MFVLLALSIFYIIYGICGLFGKIKIAEKYKGHKWTKEYTKKQGVSYILLGFPWLILYFAFSQYCPTDDAKILIVILISLPALIYSVFTYIKYHKLLKQE